MAHFDELRNYIVGGCCVDDAGNTGYAGTDGWYYKFTPGESNVGQATLLGGLTTFTTYDPMSSDICITAGESFVYALFFQTGTSYFESVFDLSIGVDANTTPATVVHRLSLGEGLAVTPNLHGGEGDAEGDERITALIGTSTTAIVQIRQPYLPINERTGRTSWKIEATSGDNCCSVSNTSN